MITSGIVMSFVGMFDWGLERGQAPACLVGALANVLMVGGYVCFNLRRFVRKLRTSLRMASRLAGLGAAEFLATGSETFVPRMVKKVSRTPTCDVD